MASTGSATAATGNVAKVHLISEPAGAQVWQGPKLLGTAPLTVRVDLGGTLSLTLAHPGYDDLNYTVQASDGPSLTLRLPRRTHKLATPSTTKDKSRVDTREPGKPAPRVPKVTPIDD
jgi:hypothetical protein